MPPIGLCVQLACLWETSARVPGNAHRFRDFSDTTYLDFLASAAAVAPVLEGAAIGGIGATVLAAVEATRGVARGNTNLGILLLLAPLAAVPRDRALRLGVADILAGLTVDDARAVYRAIRLAAPAGLGEVPEQDVQQEPTATLREVMALAAERDLVARQYASGFRAVFDDGVPDLEERFRRAATLEEAVIGSHLYLMSRFPDSLIARKRGLAEAEEAAVRAASVLRAGWPGTRDGRRAAAELDDWLRAAERGRNPGTTSDLVTACLFAMLREGRIALPPCLPWTMPDPVA